MPVMTCHIETVISVPFQTFITTVMVKTEINIPRNIECNFTSRLLVIEITAIESYCFWLAFWGADALVRSLLSTVYSNHGMNISSQLCSLQKTSLLGAGL